MDTPTPANFGWPDFTKDIANLRNDISSLHMFGILLSMCGWTFSATLTFERRP